MTDTVAPSRRIGRYVLGEILGRGAMGVVYKADDPLIARTVAIKLLHITRALSPEQAAIVRERFLREAQTAGNLDHPHIVRVLDAGCDDDTGELYLVMEYLRGASLEPLAQEGGMARERICELVRQIGSALDAAHARGIIHRDVKPANILFADDGSAKITDFGIARIASSQLTQDMRDLGTPIYMSPEQVTGRTLDGRADLFSLGVIAYHLLVGVPPFSGKNTVSVAYQIVHSSPPLPSSVAPDLPPGVDRVMTRILAKDPDERHGSGREFHEDFSRVLLGLPADTRTAKAPKPWRGVVNRRFLGLVGILVLAGGALWMQRHSQSSSIPLDDPARASLREPPAARSVPEATSESRVASKGTSAVSPQSASKSKKAIVTGPPSPAAGGPASRRSTPEVKAGAGQSSTKMPPSDAQIPKAVAQGTALDPTQRPAPAGENASAQAGPAPEAERLMDSAPRLPALSGKSAALNIRLGHRIQGGTLSVWLDGKPLLSDAFEKRNRILPYHTSEWLGIPIPPGRHEITAQVESAKGKLHVSEPLAVEVEAEGTLDVRMALKDDAIVFKRTE